MLFIHLCVSSPIQELMSTPQVQVKRLRKELAREGDVRDELERELAERITLLSEQGKRPRYDSHYGLFLLRAHVRGNLI